MDEPSRLDDEQTDRAVDDIVARESDQLLADEDEHLAEVAAESEGQRPGLFRRFFHAWFGTSKGRWLTFILLVATAISLGAVPKSRYAILNAVGVRAQLSVQVLDKSTLQPLAGITVSAAGDQAQTDKNGRVRLEDLRLGPAELVLAKPGFAKFRRSLTVGWGSNPQGSVKLEPTGTRYAFLVTDYLSGQGVATAQATSGQATAQADDTGLIVVSLEKPTDTFEVVLSAEGYRSEQMTINAADVNDRAVRMVLARKHAFLSNRKGTLDLYKIDIDGKSEQLVLSGTGQERDDTVLLLHPNANASALVSRRSSNRAADGRAFAVLTIADLSTNQTDEVVTSEYIDVLGWAGNRLVYVHTVSGLNADDAKRQRLMSYDFKSKNNKELAAANAFNAAILAAGQVYYAPAAAYQNGINVSLFRLAPDGSSSGVIMSREVQSLVRTAYDRLSLATTDGWFDYQLGGQSASGAAPANVVSRRYVDNTPSSYSVWSERQNSQDALIVYDAKTAQERVLRNQLGLSYPLNWLNDTTVVYRVRTGQVTADYAISILGGEAQKITNVTGVGASR